MSTSLARRVVSARIIVRLDRKDTTVAWLPGQGWFSDCACQHRDCRHVRTALTAVLTPTQPRRTS